MTLTNGDWAGIAASLGAQIDDDLLALERPRFNIAPTDTHLILRAPAEQRLELAGAGWGFARPGPRAGPPVINARSETLLERPMFRSALAQRRCVVIADGFFEWTRFAKTDRRPGWFHRADHGLLLLAGLFQDDGPRFVVLTTAANATVATVHDRMPVVLAAADVARWLAHPDTTLLRPLPASALQMTPVSTRVNSVAHDDPACLAPPESSGNPTPASQLLLFR